MASPIRTIFLGLLITSIFVYGYFVFSGAFAIANNLPINATVKAQYEQIVGNASAYGGAIGPVSQLEQTASSTQQSISNPNLLSLLINSVGLVTNFIGSIVNVFNSIVLLASIPLAAIGIPTAFAYGVSLIALVGLISLGIISAIFLFPV